MAKFEEKYCDECDECSGKCHINLWNVWYAKAWDCRSGIIHKYQ